MHKKHLISSTVDTSSMFDHSPGVTPPAPPTVTPPRQIAGFDLVPAGLAVGASVGLIGVTLAGLAYLTIPAAQTARTAWLIFPLGCASGLITAGILIARWMYQAATRPWRIEDEQRYAAAAALTLEDQDLPTVSAPDLLKLAGYNLIVFHYTTGSICTREQCESELHMTQDQWNKINAILKAAGIKGPRDWTPDVTFDSAIATWRNISIDETTAIIPTDRHQWQRIKL